MKRDGLAATSKNTGKQEAIPQKHSHILAMAALPRKVILR
jgi:hypothetical protein